LVLFVRTWLTVPAGLMALLMASVGCDDRAAPSGASTAEPATATPAVFRPDIDSRPTVAVVTVDTVYVTSAGANRFPPQVYRIDATTGSVLGRRTATGQPNGAAIAPSGQIWVAGKAHEDQPTGDGIAVFDASSLVVDDLYQVPGDALSVAAVADTMWVGSAGHVYELDPADGTVVGTFTITGSAYQLVTVGSYVVVGEGSAVDVLDTDGRSVIRRDLSGGGSLRIAASGDALWGRVPVGDAGEIHRFDPRTLADLVPPVKIGSTDGGIVVTADGAWAVDRTTSELVHVDEAGASARQPAPDITAALAATPDGDVLLSRVTGLSYASLLGN
jgi:outer membrane protein assembly factor BamB